MTHILIPREPNSVLLRPFTGCPADELPLAWAAMVRAAEVQHARAGAAPAAVAGPAREEIAALRAEHGITSTGRGIKEFEQVDAFVRAVLQRWGAATALEAPAVPTSAVPVAVATQVIENLLQLARIVNTAVEDWGETKEDDSMEVIFHKEEADKMEAILEFFDGLPDAPAEEGVIESGPLRAARVLRAQAAPAAPAAPAVDAETIEDAERFRAMANAALTDDEVFGRALDQHPDMGGDATIDDVRAMFDAARAAQTKEGGA